MSINSFSSQYEKPFIVGVDVGGTKIAAGVVDAQGQVSGRVMLPTDVSSPPATTLQSIVAAINASLNVARVKEEQIAGVGLGVPGKVDPERGIGLLAVNLGWQNVPVKSTLEAALNLPCAIENDVSAAALGESLYGGGRGLANFVYLSLGTGVAARMIIGGQLYRGTNGLAGEIGHAIFVPGGPLCMCGAHGCLEALASGPAIARRALEALQTGSDSLLRQNADPKLMAEQVVEAAIQGDALAQQVLTEAATHLAYALYLLAMAYDPQVVVLGGGLALGGGPLITAIQAGVAHWLDQSPIFREILTLEDVRLSSMQRDSGILGAAALVTGRSA